MSNKSKILKKRDDMVLKINSILQPKNDSSMKPLDFIIKSVNDINHRGFVASKHIELFLIAKVLPKVFTEKDFHSCIAKTEFNSPGLATTVFFCIATSYDVLKQPYPIVLADLLYRDVVGQQEFCNFETADIYVKQVQILYFFPKKYLNDEFLSIEIIRNHKFKEEELDRIIKGIDYRVSKIGSGRLQSVSFECFIFFLPLDTCLKRFESVFKVASEQYPVFVNRIIDASRYFLTKCNSNNSECISFLQKFVQINANNFNEEYKKAIEDIRIAQPQFSSIITSYFSSTGSKISLNQTNLIKSVVETDKTAFNEFIKDYQQLFTNAIPFSSFTIGFLNSLLVESQKDTKIFYRVPIVFEISLNSTKFINKDEEIQELMLLIERYILFIYKNINNLTKKEYVPSLSTILVPIFYRHIGIPFREIALETLFKISSFFNHQEISIIKSIYTFIIYAMKYQNIFGMTPIKACGPEPSKVIYKCLLDMIHKSFDMEFLCLLISSLLIIGSPDRIGKDIWNQLSENRNFYITFMLDCFGDMKSEFTELNPIHDTIHNSKEARKCALYYSKSKWISSLSAFNCINPLYIAEVLMFIEVYPPQKWINQLNISSYPDNSVVLTLCHLQLISYADSSSKQIIGCPTFPTVYPNSVLSYYMQLIKPKINASQKNFASSVFYQYLTHDEITVRIASFAMICLIYSEHPTKIVFKLGDDPSFIKHITQAILIEMDTYIIEQYFRVLSELKPPQKYLYDFMTMRPIVYSNYGISQNQLVDMNDIPDFSSCFFNNEYEADKPLQIITPDRSKTIIEIPIGTYDNIYPIEAFKDQITHESFLLASNPTDTNSKVINLITRFEASNKNCLYRHYVIATLKRMIIQDNIAFQVFMDVLQPVIFRGFASSSMMENEFFELFEFFLVLVFSKKFYSIVEFEMEKIIEFLRSLPNIDRINGKEYIKAIYDSILDDISFIRKYLIEDNLPMEILYSYTTSRSIPISKFIYLEHPDFPDQTLKIIPFSIIKSNRPDVANDFIIPLVLSSSVDSVVLYLSTIRKIDNSLADFYWDNILSVLAKMNMEIE